MLFRVVPGQQLGEIDDVSAAQKTRWPLFHKWSWTPDAWSKLEAQDIKVCLSLVCSLPLSLSLSLPVSPSVCMFAVFLSLSLSLFRARALSLATGKNHYQ